MIMSTNQEEDVVEDLDLPAEAEEGKEDTTDWKAEAKKLQDKAIKQRETTKDLKAKLKALTPAEKKAEDNQAKSGELDNGQKALLVAYGVKGADEMALAKSWMGRTGDDIDVMINDDIFKAKLANLRETKESKAAIPSNTNRSNNSAKDSLEYWSQKYNTGTQLNDVPKEFRTKVLNAKVKGDGGQRMFYNG